MPIITELGGGVVLFVLSIAIIFLQKKDKRKAGILILAGLTAAYYIVDFFKQATARLRPFVVFPDAHFFVKTAGFAFPSGHTTIAFMTAAILSRFFKRGWLFFGLAALVGFSRVYVGAHYVSDVLAGALLGTLIGYGLVKIFQSSS